MIDEITQILALVNAKSTVTAMTGTFVSATATGCTVDVGNGRVPAQFGTAYLPAINEAVQVWFIGSQVFMMGPTLAKAGQGTVVSVAAGLVTVSTDFGPATVPYDSRLTPTAGQVLKLSWNGGTGYADSVMSTSPTGGVAPPAPGGGAITHTDEFTAIDAGSYRGGWWTPQVYASDTNLGVFVYGSKIPDTIPSSAVVSSIQVYVSAQQITGAAPNFALHAYQSKPGGSPTLTSPTAVGIAPGWITLPTSFANALRGGGGSYGIGLDHGGYSILHSLAQDGDSGRIRIVSQY